MLLLNIFSWCGTVFAVMLFASPVTTAIRIKRERSVLQFDPSPYFLSMLQCALWVSYSVITPNRLPSLFTNACGLALEVTWCLVFMIYSVGQKRRSLVKWFVVLVMLWLAVTMVAVLVATRLNWKPLEVGVTLKTEALGVLCVLLNIIMYAAPLGAIRLVIQTRSVEYMPLPLSLMTFLASSSWLGYSYLVKDLWIFIPSVAGVALGVAQLLVYGFSCSRGKIREVTSGAGAPLDPEACR